MTEKIKERENEEKEKKDFKTGPWTLEGKIVLEKYYFLILLKEAFFYLNFDLQYNR